MHHTTCFAHLLHNAAEKIRFFLPFVDQLIANTKAATVKNETRQQQFKDSGIPYPPQPVLTRWGSWVNAATYYSRYFEEVQSIIHTWDTRDGTLTLASQQRRRLWRTVFFWSSG